MERGRHSATEGADWRDDFRELEDAFVSIAICGKGTYGCVYKVHRRSNPRRFYAIKKIEHAKEKEGFPLTAVREIALLQRLRHPNIITLRQIFASRPSKWNGYRRSCCLVLEYMEHDFLGLMRHARFAEAEVKRVMLEVLKGVAYLHSQRVIHRDIKGGNLLMNRAGEVKIADFGLARLQNDRHMTHNVVTFWYRAPELLLGQQSYDEKIDVWSLGCIFGELMLGEILFMGQDVAQQLGCIFRRLGDPERAWPEIALLSHFRELGIVGAGEGDLEEMLRRRCAWASAEAFDLLRQMLTYDPRRRVSAEEALQHAFFSQPPQPCAPAAFSRLQGEYHNYMMRDAARKRKEESTDKVDPHREREERSDRKEAKQSTDRLTQLIENDAPKLQKRTDR